MTVLSTENLVYKYSVGTPFERTALNGVSMSVESGELFAVIGHTGSGKSTLIEHFNALLKPLSGKVLLEGEDINASKEKSHAARFKVGLCFQYPEYQLFESTVFKDIAFGPGNIGLSKEEIERRVLTAAQYVGLSEDMLEKSPFDLSGGEKRRVAIAGVMAMEPSVLVMDEPAAGLDPGGRRRILSLIENYRKITGKTVIIVSHSMEDVAAIADRILVLKNGEAARIGTPDEIFSHESELIEMGLDLPQITKIMLRLKENGVDAGKSVHTCEGAADALCALLKKEGVL